MLNVGVKKLIAGITSLVVIGGGSAFATHTVTTQADEESAYQLVKEAKEELTEQFTKEIEEIKITNEQKDIQIAELTQQLNEANQKIQEQQQLNETVTTQADENTNDTNENDYATHEYVDTTVNNAKQEVQNNTQQQITQELEDRGLHKPTTEEKENIPSSFCAPAPEPNNDRTSENH